MHTIQTRTQLVCNFKINYNILFCGGHRVVSIICYILNYSMLGVHGDFTTNTRHCSMLGQRRRCSANSELSLAQRLRFAWFDLATSVENIHFRRDSTQPNGCLSSVNQFVPFFVHSKQSNWSRVVSSFCIQFVTVFKSVESSLISR